MSSDNAEVLKELAAARNQRIALQKRTSSQAIGSRTSSKSPSSKSSMSSEASTASSSSSKYDLQRLNTHITPTSAGSKRYLQHSYGFGAAARPLPRRYRQAGTRQGIVHHIKDIPDTTASGSQAAVERTFLLNDGRAPQPRAYRKEKLLSTHLGEVDSNTLSKGLGLDVNAAYTLFSDGRHKGPTAGLNLDTNAEALQRGFESMAEQISGGVVSKGPMHLQLAANTFNPDLTGLPKPPRPPRQVSLDGAPPMIPPPPPLPFQFDPSGPQLLSQDPPTPPQAPSPPANASGNATPRRRTSGSSYTSSSAINGAAARHTKPPLGHAAELPLRNPSHASSGFPDADFEVPHYPPPPEDWRPPPHPPAPRDWFTPFLSPASRKSSDASTISEYETVTVNRDGQISREATKHNRYRKLASGAEPRTEMLVQGLEGPDREYHKDFLWRKKNGEVHRTTSDIVPNWGTSKPGLFKIAQRRAAHPNESRVAAKITARRRKSWTKEQVKNHNAYPKALPYLARRFGMKVDDQTALDIDYQYENEW